MEILFATGNKHKLAEVESVLGQSVKQISIDLPEIQAVNVKDVIEEKALVAFKKIGKPVLVEDTSLGLLAWNGLPGALIKWFLKTVDNEGICKMMSSFENKNAKAETCLGYHDGDNFFVFSGVIEGKITEMPRGDKGFGWDAIFQPNGSDKTFAEMSPEEKGAVSMRKLAVLKLKEFLSTQ